MNELESSFCAPSPDLSNVIAVAECLYKAAKAPATIKAFDSDLACFRTFATQNHLPYLPSDVETVVLYVSSLAAADPPMAYATIRQRLAGNPRANSRHRIFVAYPGTWSDRTGDSSIPFIINNLLSQTARKL